VRQHWMDLNAIGRLHYNERLGAFLSGDFEKGLT